MVKQQAINLIKNVIRFNGHSVRVLRNCRAAIDLGLACLVNSGSNLRPFQ